MYEAPKGYVAVAGISLSAGDDLPADTCLGCVFQHRRTRCPECSDIDELLCVAIANESLEHENIIFQEAPTRAVPEKLDMHKLRHQKLLLSLIELIEDYEANNDGMPTLQKLRDWAEKQARATDHVSLHPGV